jgi:hypothetical protein
VPKFTTKDLENELEQLNEAPAASYYLSKELNRRRASKRNPGASVKFNDKRHEQMREASRRYREKG